MNQFNFNQVGGFPMTTRILDELQKAFAVFNGLGAISGDKTIISGCVTTGSNVSDGVVYVNGEVFEFRGGTAQTKVKIVEVVETLVFEDGAAKSVIKTRYVGFGTGVGAMDWGDFKRGIQTKELQALFANINNSLTTIVAKLDTIDENAKVQVNSDWNSTTGKSQILNKPTIVSPFILKGIFSVGNVAGGGGSTLTVNFSDIGTNAYMVVGTLVSKGNDWNQDNDVMFVIREKTSTSFKILLREVAGATQNLEFEYALIPL